MDFKYDVSIVIPTYNEEGSMQKIIEDTFHIIQDVNKTIEVIVINDGSTDNTKSIVTSLIENYPSLSLINISRNRGKSAALMDGFAASQGKYIGFIDADYQFIPDDFVKFIEILDNEDYDVVNGYRQKRNDPIFKRIPSKIFNRLNKMTFGVSFKDWNSGIKLMRAEVAKSLLLRKNYHRYILGLAHYNHFSIKEIPITHREREFGKSKYGPSRFIIGFFDLISLKLKTIVQYNPFLLFGFFGSILTLIGFAELSYTMYLRFFTDRLSDITQELLLGVLLVLFGSQLFIFGYITEKVSDLELRQKKILDRLDRIS